MRFSAFQRRLSACCSRLTVVALGACVFAAASSFASAAIFPEGIYTSSYERRGVFEEILGETPDLSSGVFWEEQGAFEEELASYERAFDGASAAQASGVFTDELYRGFEERPVVESSQGYYTGSAFGVSRDAVVRGAVNLPPIEAIQFWGNGYYGSGHIRPRNWDERIKTNNTGAALGLNLPLGNATISAYYNYQRNRTNLSQRRVRQEDNGVGMAFYLNSGGFYITALGVYGDDNYKARDIAGQLGAISFGGYQATGFFETGYEMATRGMFVLKPFGSYQYTNLKHGAFDVQTLRQFPGKRNYNSCLMTLGSRVDLNLAGLDVFTMEGRMAWVTQLRKRDESIQTFCYGRVPGTVSMAQPYFKGNGAGSDFFWGGIGLRLCLRGSLSVSADYDCLVNKYQTLNEGSLSLLFGF